MTESTSKPIICFDVGYTPDFNSSMKSAYGAELALKSLATAFSLTHEVYIFGECIGDACVNGIHYCNSSYLNQFMTLHTVDVMIVSRYIHHFIQFDNKINKTYLWLHDILAHGAWKGMVMPENGKYLLKNIIHKIDGVVVLTEWHKNVVLQHYNFIDPSKIFVIGNAIEVSRYNNKQIERVKNRFIYTSNPTRGLQQLVNNFNSIKEEIPDAELWVYRGEEDFGSEHKDLLELIKTTDYIKFMGRVENNSLAEHQLASDFWYYPTAWPETYCISALEAMAAGCICIASDLAALKDTVGDRGVLLSGGIHSDEYFKEAKEKIIEISQDDELKEKIRDKCIEWAMKQSWSERVKEWLNMFGYVQPDQIENIELGSLGLSETNNFYDGCSINVINLERRNDRWDAFIQHASKIGLKNYSRFNATDGKTIVLENINSVFHIQDGFVGKRWANLTHNYWAGTLGAATSHLRAWQEASNGYKDFIVLEDDIDLHTDFVKKWNDIYSLIKDDSKWDLLYFGFNDDEHGESLYGDSFVCEGVMQFSNVMRFYGGGAYGYVLRPKGALKLLRLVGQFGVKQPIDHFMIDHFDSLCVYKTVPHLVKAKIYGINGTDTDIQNCRMVVPH